MAAKKGYRPVSKGHAHKQPRGLKPKSLMPLFCVSFILWCVVAAISIYVATGCLYTNALYIVQVHSNDTVPVQVQVGYFGTCVSANTNADNPNGTTTKTACLPYVKYDRDETVESQFMEELKEANGDNPIPDINEPLKKILDITEELRGKIFPAGAPISFLIIYLLTIISFWILLASSNHTKTYKAIFAFTTLLNSYALTIGFIVATTTFQTCRGLIFPAEGNTGTIEPGVYVTESTLLQDLQWAVVAVSVVLQLCVAGMFVQRQASGGEATLRGPSLNIKSYKLCC
ncbi:hypothetical protein GGR54DRAFT_622370 [Hypoxylon sp. NC1633]|nr:hypothetical protein GGR54DRAFT_622370 [Hypoxylon sp. NC1633]